MQYKVLLKAMSAAVLAFASVSAFADAYNIDPNHTYPSFGTEHMGISVFRGKFTKTSGTITLDRKAKTGTVDVTIDANSIDFGHEKLNNHVKSADFFNTQKFPTITYRAKSIKFDGDKPATIEGELTMLGVTKPVPLTVNKFKCIQHPALKREVCGADASGSFNRTDFGMNYGVSYASPEVKLAIQVEAIKAD